MSVVLIVEDELLEQEFLRSVVLDELNPDDTLLTCESGLEAVELARQHQPDIIIMDVRIPELDGSAPLEKSENFFPMHASPFYLLTPIFLMRKKR